jgi:hypothetical protein
MVINFAASIEAPLEIVSADSPASTLIEVSSKQN